MSLISGKNRDCSSILVEVGSGKRFGAYVKERIFDPLGMKNSTYLFSEDNLDLVCEQYKYYSEEKKYVNIGKKINRYKPGQMYESGGAGITSTTEDYMLFLDGVHSGKVLRPEILELMTKNHHTEEQRKTFWGPDGYGYGLGVRTPLGDGKRSDYGWGGAAGAFAAIDPQNDITLYYSQHVLTSPFARIRKDCIEAIELDLGFEAFVSDMWNGNGNTLA